MLHVHVSVKYNFKDLLEKSAGILVLLFEHSMYPYIYLYLI